VTVYESHDHESNEHHDHESHDLVETLAARLGNRHYSSIDGGRADIVGVITDEMKVSREEADAMTQRLIDAGRIRYVTGDEQDVEHDVEAQRDEYSDAANRRDAGYVDPSAAIAGTADPGATVGTGLTGAAIPPAVAAAPTVATGNAPAPAAVPLAMTDANLAGSNDMGRGGYWDLAEARGVVPSDSRKGQVEPAGI
jgi:hypothetical protein